MSKYMVTIGAGTGPGSVVQSCAMTALLNKKPIATVGSIATHPLSPDTVIEGMPTILLNGIPITFSGAKTAMGGCLIPNTSVKIGPASSGSAKVIPTPTGVIQIKMPEFTPPSIPERYVGFEAAPRVENREEKEEEPEESAEVTLYSDYAQQQLIELAQSDGETFFTYHMINIFGKDVTPKALHKLYEEAKNGTIENPPIVVCKNRIYGLQAAYNSDTNEILVCEEIVYKAIEDNKYRNILMAALVEEYGHHIDYLLRYEFDDNENKDAAGDEGARFAYQGLYNISYTDFMEASSVPFATAETPDGNFDLDWDLTVLREVLDEYTAHRQDEDYDDHVADHIEGFKVEDLSYGGAKENAFGHENIQKDAILQTNREEFINNINYLYRGNWMRDYSQLLTPFFLFNLGKFDTNIESFWDLIQKYKDGTLMHGEDNDVFNNLFHPKDTIPLVQDIVRVLAIRKFHNQKVTLTTQEELELNPDWRKLVDGKWKVKRNNMTVELDGLIPGFGELLGVSAPHDHFDNPYGLDDLSSLNEYLDDETKKVSQFNGEIKEKECSIDKAFGVKSYIRTEQNASMFGTKMVFGHLTETIQKALENIQSTDSYKKTMGYIQLGGVLHTVQDFYAHSNYSETYLASIWFDRVRTWTLADQQMDYSNLIVHGSEDEKLVFDEDSKWTILTSYGKTDTITQRDKVVKWGPTQTCTAGITGAKVNAVHKKGFYTPITTGTYDMEDLLATAMVMIDGMSEVKPTGKASDKIPLQPGARTANDLLCLVLVRYYDARRIENGGQGEKDLWEKRLNDFFELRDKTLTEYYKKRNLIFYELSAADVVDVVKDLFGILKEPFEWIEEIIRNVIGSIVEFIVHNTMQALLSFIRTYQLAIKSNLDESKDLLSKSIEEWKISKNPKDIKEIAATLGRITKGHTKNALFGNYPLGHNPSHTMLAKDEPGGAIHSLSGNMAIIATKYLLDEVQQDIKARNTDINCSTNQAMKNIINHPLFDSIPSSSLFREDVEKWAKDHPLEVLQLCVTNYLFESIRASQALVGTVLDKFNKFKQNNFFNLIEKIKLTSDGGITQSVINDFNTTYKDINKKLEELIRLYTQSPYREMDRHVFKEWYKLYSDLGVYAERPEEELEKIAEEWLEKMDKCYEQISNFNLDTFKNRTKEAIDTAFQWGIDTGIETTQKAGEYIWSKKYEFRKEKYK